LDFLSETIVFVNCTSRKRRPATPPLRAHGLTSGTVDEVARLWAERLDAALQTYPASQLYCGRAVTEALAAAETLRGALYFVSAGLGVVAADERVPAYNLTVSRSNPDSVLSRLPGGSESARWWSALTMARGNLRPLATRVLATRGLVLIAVPRTYLELLSEELHSLPPGALVRLRIIGPRHADDLPEMLRAQWMPYDRRLEASAGFAGTESDFPQRALRHFVRCVLPADPYGSAEAHGAIVDSSLGTRRVERREPGKRMSDEELAPLLRKLWLELGGHRGQILRELRRKHRIACEQSRFKRLADQLQEHKRAARSA
jgi:hypothetical protein